MKFCAVCEKPIFNRYGDFCKQHYTEIFLPNKKEPWMNFFISSTRKMNRQANLIYAFEVPLESINEEYD